MRYLILVLIFVCPSVYAQIGPSDFGGSVHSNWCSSSTATNVCSDAGYDYWLVYQNGTCQNGSVQYTCRVRNGTPCTSGTWNQSTQQCDTSCPIPGTSGPECTCPAGTKLGYRGVAGGGLEQACIDTDLDPDTCENPIGTVNGQPVCDNRPNDCPADYQYGFINGEEVCIPPVDGPSECGEGSYYGTVNGVTQCWEPDPDIEDPDYPPNQQTSSSSGASSSQGSGGDGGDGGTGTGESFDDSRIVSRLDQLKERGDTANEHLENIADSLNGEGAIFDGGVSSGVQSLYQSEYPNGVAGVWEAQKAALMDTPVFGFMNQFQFDYNDTSLPVWSMCFDLGSMGNFGCKDLAVPAYVWAFVKIVMLVSTAFLCRRLIFGG